jgi:hypothetical protein
VNHHPKFLPVYPYLLLIESEILGQNTVFHGKNTIFHGQTTIFHGKNTIFHGKKHPHPVGAVPYRA